MRRYRIREDLFAVAVSSSRPGSTIGEVSSTYSDDEELPASDLATLNDPGGGELAGVGPPAYPQIEHPLRQFQKSELPLFFFHSNFPNHRK